MTASLMVSAEPAGIFLYRSRVELVLNWKLWKNQHDLCFLIVDTTPAIPMMHISHLFLVELDKSNVGEKFVVIKIDYETEKAEAIILNR